MNHLLHGKSLTQQSSPAHFSRYGVFGAENNQPGSQQSPPPSGSGSSSGGSKSDSSSSKKTISEIDGSKPGIEPTKEQDGSQEIKKDESIQNDDTSKGLPGIPIIGKTIASNFKKSNAPNIIVLIFIIGLIVYYIISKAMKHKAFKFGKKSKKK